MINAKEQIQQDKVIAIARKVPVENVCDLAQALLDGGLHCIEVTFDHTNDSTIQATLDSIRALEGRFSGKLAIGAGTLLSVDEVRQAYEAGAKYIISPDAKEAVIRETKKLGMLSIPGAFTPTEVCFAYDFGADFVKVFPAANLGAAYIKALRGPLNHIPLLAVGGINPENIAEYLKAGCCGAGCGGGLVSLKAIQNGDFASITTVARAYVKAVSEAEI